MHLLIRRRQNERQRLDLDDGRSIGEVQIAGWWRRIVCYLRKGSKFLLGSDLGSRFGLGVDIYLPSGVILKPLLVKGALLAKQY